MFGFGTKTKEECYDKYCLIERDIQDDMALMDANKKEAAKKLIEKIKQNRKALKDSKKNFLKDFDKVIDEYKTLSSMPKAATNSEFMIDEPEVIRVPGSDGAGPSNPMFENWAEKFNYETDEVDSEDEIIVIPPPKKGRPTKKVTEEKRKECKEKKLVYDKKSKECRERKKPVKKKPKVDDDVIVTKIVKKTVDQKFDNLLPWNAYDNSDDEDVIVIKPKLKSKSKEKLTFEFKDLPGQIQEMIKQRAGKLKLDDIRKNKSEIKTFKFKERIPTLNDDNERIDIISVKVGLNKSGSKKRYISVKGHENTTTRKARKNQRKKKLSRPFEIWNALVKEHGGKIPKINTKAYKKLKAKYDEIIEKENITIKNPGINQKKKKCKKNKRAKVYDTKTNKCRKPKKRQVNDKFELWNTIITNYLNERKELGLTVEIPEKGSQDYKELKKVYDNLKSVR
jgi:hypothetical protein